MTGLGVGNGATVHARNRRPIGEWFMNYNT